jgi:hypothetical protein
MSITSTLVSYLAVGMEGGNQPLELIHMRGTALVSSSLAWNTSLDSDKHTLLLLNSKNYFHKMFYSTVLSTVKTLRLYFCRIMIS